MKKLNIKIPKSSINSVYYPLICDKHRYVILYGGAGSGKSMFAAQRYIIKLLSQKRCNLLVVRAVGKTNRDSTFALFKQIISMWGGMSTFFCIKESDLRIKCTVNGNEIIFKGLDDSEKLKSITFSTGELTDIWVEEASEISEADFNQLDIRLRGGKSQKQIVVTFNPIDANHWLKHRFFDVSSKNAVISHTTFLDNRFIDSSYAELLTSYKQTDPYYYNVYCMGNWGILGESYFDSKKIYSRLQSLPNIKTSGEFIYEYNGTAINNRRFQSSSDGFIKIYKFPEPCVPYVIGGDTAGEGTDFFTAQVINNITGEQVASMRLKTDEDLYAAQLYCLGKYYNNALISTENNYSTHPTRELIRLGYGNLYMRETTDRLTNKLTHSIGFVTSSKTRPLIISELKRIVREQINLINDKQTLEEMLTFIRNSKGRPEAASGAHDDLIMALSIAYFCRDQQCGFKKPVPSKPQDEYASFLQFGG